VIDVPVVERAKHVLDASQCRLAREAKARRLSIKQLELEVGLSIASEAEASRAGNEALPAVDCSRAVALPLAMTALVRRSKRDSVCATRMEKQQWIGLERRQRFAIFRRRSAAFTGFGVRRHVRAAASRGLGFESAGSPAPSHRHRPC